MGKHSKKLSKSKIIYLDNDEMESPIKVVQAFFNAAWLPSHLRYLKAWRDDLLPVENGKEQSSPSDLVYNHELTMKLVEAAWLLRDSGLGKVEIKKEDMGAVGKWHLAGERKKSHGYPVNLTLREMLAPCRVLQKMFDRFSLKEYNDILKTWLYDAVTESYMEESLEKVEVIVVYDNLVRLFEAMWLIHMRTEPGLAN